ncbi:MAG: HAD hydrolase-like protein [Bryobacteraceae bacterium]|nr:HAD hydrolase-like protein [Bryobacteraceae bacterium]
MPANALVLFDIDGTLLRRAGPHHRQALEDAIRHVIGRPATTDGIPVSGMLDGDILMRMLKASGMKRADSAAALPTIIEKAQALYVRRCPDLRSKVCPGVPGFLRGLSARSIPLGLVTGNLSRIGWTKMRRAGLRHHFLLGAFADQGRTRAALARLAIRDARRQGLIGANAIVSLVGDHPNDIAAARANGLRSVAVGTGVVPLDELAACGPDILVPDLRSLAPDGLLCA